MGNRGPEAAGDPLPRDHLVHPRPGALGLTRVQIQIKLTDEAFVRVGDPEKTHVRMPGLGHIGENANAIEGFDKPEHAFQDLRFREISLHFLIGKRVAFCAQFFRCKRDIPSLQLLDSELRACELLQLSVIPACVRQRPRGEVIEEVEGSLG